MQRIAAITAILLSVSASVVRASLDVAETSSLREQFDREGYLVLRDFFGREFLEEWATFEQRVFEEIFEELYENGHTTFSEDSRRSALNSRDNEYAMGIGKHNGFREIVMRSRGRYDISLMHEKIKQTQPDMEPIFSSLSDVVTGLLETPMSDMNMNYGFVVSTPGAEAQDWHSDGEHLDMGSHLSCHCLNVFIPLVNVTNAKGPTEIFPASHFETRQPAPMHFTAAQLQPPVAPTLKLGDVLIFDYRTLHRGKANISKRNRPLLMLTLSKPWFEDGVNYPSNSLLEQGPYRRN